MNSTWRRQLRRTGKRWQRPTPGGHGHGWENTPLLVPCWKGRMPVVDVPSAALATTSPFRSSRRFVLAGSPPCAASSPPRRAGAAARTAACLGPWPRALAASSAVRSPCRAPACRSRRERTKDRAKARGRRATGVMAAVGRGSAHVVGDLPPHHRCGCGPRQGSPAVPLRGGPCAPGNNPPPKMQPAAGYVIFPITRGRLDAWW